MRIICSYCNTFQGEKAPLDDNRISHGMCADCYEQFERQLDGLQLVKYIDDLDSPILILNKDGRLVASNKLAAEMLGKSGREMLGLLAGEVMACDHARSPERCGNTIHCEVCTIRNTILRTMNTGLSMKNKQVKLRRNGREIDLVISTYFREGMVEIVLEG